MGPLANLRRILAGFTREEFERVQRLQLDRIRERRERARQRMVMLQQGPWPKAERQRSREEIYAEIKRLGALVRKLDRQAARRAKRLGLAVALAITVGGQGCASTPAKATAEVLTITADAALARCMAKTSAAVGDESQAARDARRACLRLPWELTETRDAVEALAESYVAIDAWIRTGDPAAP